MSNVSDPIFSPSCPSGGQYYACGIGAKFVGCCGSDPCNDAGCPAGNLRAMSFDPAYWNTTQMPDQQCAMAGQQWWSCAATNPPFIGCCTVNPCTAGCPQANLVQGTLSSVASIANAFDPQPPLPVSSATTSGSTPTETSSTSPGSSSHSSTGLIVGIVVGGSALVFLAVALIWWCRRKSQHRKREKQVLNPGLSPHPAFQNEKASNYQDITSETSTSAQGTPLPVYGFQSPSHQQPYHQQIVHEADSANQIRQSPAFSSPNTAYSFSPGMNNNNSPSYYPQPPSELMGDSNIQQRQPDHLTGLGLQRLSTVAQAPVELGDSERGTDDARDREQRP